MPRPPETLEGLLAKERQRIKKLKKKVARADRIAREGLTALDVRCPRCGAPPFLSVKRDPGWCRASGNPLLSLADHKARTEMARITKQSILDEGESARKELERCQN